MNNHSTPSERDELIKFHRKERDGRIRDRIEAVLAFDEGCSYSEISRLLLLDDETIGRPIDDYFSKAKLKPENGGSKSDLNETETAKLAKHLDG